MNTVATIRKLNASPAGIVSLRVGLRIVESLVKTMTTEDRMIQLRYESKKLGLLAHILINRFEFAVNTKNPCDPKWLRKESSELKSIAMSLEHLLTQEANRGDI